MDKFVVRTQRDPQPKRRPETLPPKTKQVTIESLPRVVVVEEIIRLKLQLENELSSSEELRSALHELSSKTPSKGILLSTKIGHTVNSLRKHANEEISGLAKEVFRKWKQYIVEEESDKPMIEVRCDNRTECLRAKGRKLLVNALQVSEEHIVPKQIEQAIFFTFGRRVDNNYRRKMRTIVFTLQHKESNIRLNLLQGKMKIEELLQGQSNRATF